jgi:ABC-type Fe3+ transport system permease subunit
MPIIAFDVWLFYTTGRWQLRQWVELKKWRQLAGCIFICVALAIWITFFVQFQGGSDLRVQGFPVPRIFYHLEGKTWTKTVSPSILPYVALAADFLTGLTAPFIPYKIAEFLKKVKAELK